jgi:4-amino-4-deoxy-L-arabinose transferase-like glycosyltransferase
MQRAVARAGLALAAILLLGIGLRLPYLSSPLLDAHRWRQIDTAVMARYFYEDSANPFYPQVNWGGARGYVESEFPLVPSIASLLYRVFGPDDMWGRVTTVGFSAGLIVSVFLLVREMCGGAAGRAAALLVAVSPGAVYYGRTFMPDTAMLCFAVAALYFWIDYLERGRPRSLVWSCVLLSLCILVKLPGVLVLFPMAAAAWHARGRTALADLRLWGGVAAAGLVAAVWYLHAYNIFRETGLTYGILAHPARTYPPQVSPGPWPDVFSKWSTAALLSDPEFYRELRDRIVRLHLTPVGLSVALVGLLTWRGQWSLVPASWLAAMTLFILVAGYGHLAHDYYQLPLVVIAAMYFGVAAAPLFDGEWLKTRVAKGWAGPVASGLLVTTLAILLFLESGVIRSHFRPTRLDTEMLQAGAAVARAIPERDALLIVVDEYGVTSPVLLYFAERRGWSFGPGDLKPELVDWLRKLGARYFATTEWQDLSRANPTLAADLLRYRQVPLENEPPQTRLFDLRQFRD